MKSVLCNPAADCGKSWMATFFLNRFSLKTMREALVTTLITHRPVEQFLSQAWESEVLEAGKILMLMPLPLVLDLVICAWLK